MGGHPGLPFLFKHALWIFFKKTFPVLSMWDSSEHFWWVVVHLFLVESHYLWVQLGISWLSPKRAKQGITWFPYRQELTRKFQGIRWDWENWKKLPGRREWKITSVLLPRVKPIERQQETSLIGDYYYFLLPLQTLCHVGEKSIWSAQNIATSEIRLPFISCI